jgi:hypothetical protein
MRTAIRRLIVPLAAALAFGTCGSSDVGGTQGAYAATHRVPVPQVTQPNIVFVLTDDLSMDLVPFMPHVQALQQRGITFDNYFVSDSLCCSSRASLLTGDFPHNTHVLHNFGVDGGLAAFHRHGEERRTFAVALQRAGYRTALMGSTSTAICKRGTSRTARRVASPPDTSRPGGVNGTSLAGATCSATPRTPGTTNPRSRAAATTPGSFVVSESSRCRAPAPPSAQSHRRQDRPRR